MQRTFQVDEQVTHDVEGAGVVVCVHSNGDIVVNFTTGNFRMTFTVDQQWHIAKVD